MVSISLSTSRHIGRYRTLPALVAQVRLAHCQLGGSRAECEGCDGAPDMLAVVVGEAAAGDAQPAIGQTPALRVAELRDARASRLRGYGSFGQIFEYLTRKSASPSMKLDMRQVTRQ